MNFCFQKYLLKVKRKENLFFKAPLLDQIGCLQNIKSDRDTVKSMLTVTLIQLHPLTPTG